MSAIAVILHTDGEPAAASAISAMTAAMHYRGQDGVHHQLLDACGMGHCALQISAEDRDSVQPLSDDGSRYTISLDGYVANYAELRRDLTQRGARLRNRSDAELVLQAFILWGQECLDHIDGEFAFAIYDRVENALFCACDHTGLRQLHYHWNGRTFVAATDITGVLAALDERPDPNLGYLAEHIANGWFTCDETPWQGIMRLPRGHCLTVANGKLQRREYWELPLDITTRYRTDGEYIEHYRSLLTECVAEAGRSDHPVACEVSGGLDSSAIFALANHMDRAGKWPSPGLAGFTLSAPRGTPADEARYVEALVRSTGRAIEGVPLFCPDLEWFEAQANSDQRLPFLPNTVMLRSLAKAASEQGCRISLTGQGGDQWLDGLPHYYRQSLRGADWRGFRQSFGADRRARGLGWSTRQALRQSLVAALPDVVRDRLRDLRDGERSIASGADWLSDEMQMVLKQRADAFEAETAALPADDRAKRGKLVEPFALLVYDMLNLQSVRLGVENRHPMLSRKFMEFSASTPEHIRLRGFTTKYIHREAMRDLLPRAIVDREDKAHFSQTFAPYLPEMQAFIAEQLDENTQFREVVKSDIVCGAFDSAKGAAIDRIPIWSLWGSYASAVFLEQAPNLR
ncbi:asparagine synthetase B family protein [Aurantiacibacter sp. MUD61]|uniref:asparagine synthetase B family protein n=1 Tax=Aurantiacibacter sp. MUD61 TaxID=3009083 RepID=UPI0022F13900|nr:asparagine synthase-related protein [Aurantiacibacter sp. MUD61]